MGLFEFVKRGKNKQNLIPEKNNMKTLTTFYNDCVKDFHETAMSQGVAAKGVIFIPELIPMGEKTILAFLKDPFFQTQFGNNPETYYYIIMSLCIQTGIVFASKWHANFNELKNEYVDYIIENGPADDAKKILTEEFPVSVFANQGNPFYQKIYARWKTMHDPYWKLSYPRDYTFKAMLAAYQLGISMVLEKHGY